MSISEEVTNSIRVLNEGMERLRIERNGPIPFLSETDHLQQEVLITLAESIVVMDSRLRMIEALLQAA